MAQVTVYRWDSTNNRLETMSIDSQYLSNWQGTGWSTSMPSQNTTTTSSTSDSQINALYQKYFGRDAQPNELTYWKTQSISSLENQLLTDYKNSSGLTSYDGSPIMPGQTQTTNQSGGENKYFSSDGSLVDYNGLKRQYDFISQYWSSEQKSSMPLEKWLESNGYYSTDASGNRIDLYTEQSTTNNANVFYGTTQDLANQGYQISNGKVYSNGQEIGTYGGTTNPNTNNTNGTTTGASSESTYGVNSLYRKYFDRAAEQDEIDYWSTRSLDELETALQADYQNASGHSYDGSAIQSGQTQSINDLSQGTKLQDAYRIIDDSLARGELTPEIAQLWKATIAAYPPGVEFEADKIVETFNKIKNETIDPYFSELADVAINDFQTTYSQMQSARERQLEQQNATIKSNIQNAQGNLEGSGMTFSGKGVEQLGEKSAYAQDQQLPFGGNYLEGTVNQGNRLMAESSEAEYNANIQNLGRSAEDMLGTEGANVLGINYNPAGVNLTGSLRTTKEGQYGTTLNNLINQYYNAQTLNKNINYQ